MTSEPAGTPDLDGDDGVDLDAPWPEVDLSAGPRGGAEYARLHATHRALQDRLAGAALPDDVSRDVDARLRELIGVLERHQVTESERRDGFRSDLPGRGDAFLPAYVVIEERVGWLRGTVTFGRFHLGGNGAAHGGSHPLLFDDVLGRVVNHGRPGIARTAYLTTNYRAVTPLDVELTFEARVDRMEGRKRFASGRLLGPAGELLSDCEALFVQLLPGQP